MQVALKLQSTGRAGQLQLPMLDDVEDVPLTGATALGKNCGHAQVETAALSNILNWQGASSGSFQLCTSLHPLFASYNSARPPRFRMS